MKKFFLMGLVAMATILAGLSCSKRTVAPVAPTAESLTGIESVAYAYGLLNGESFRQNLSRIPGDSALSPERVLEGFKAGFSGEKGLLASSQAKRILEGYLQGIQEEEIATVKYLNDSVLLANKARKDVVVTESGLQWRALRKSGKVSPAPQDTVVVHYVGRTIDGNEFDNSYRRNQPATFSLADVIPGWAEGLGLMTVGSRYEFYIPSSLAYGERGVGQAIPPHATLIFEVELLGVKPFVPKAKEPSSGMQPPTAGNKQK